MVRKDPGIGLEMFTMVRKDPGIDLRCLLW